MTCETVLVSSRQDFDEVILVTEIFVPEESIWIGDYPYLNRKQFIRFANYAADHASTHYSYSSTSADNIEINKKDEFTGSEASRAFTWQEEVGIIFMYSSSIVIVFAFNPVLSLQWMLIIRLMKWTT